MLNYILLKISDNKRPDSSYSWNPDIAPAIKKVTKQLEDCVFTTMSLENLIYDIEAMEPYRKLDVEREKFDLNVASNSFTDRRNVAQNSQRDHCRNSNGEKRNGIMQRLRIKSSASGYNNLTFFVNKV